MKIAYADINDIFSKLPALLIRNKKKVWFLSILVITCLMPGISNFKITSYQEQGEMLNKGESARKANERFIKNFGGQESMILTYKAKDDDIFSRQSLKTLKEVQEELISESLGLQGIKNSPLKHVTQVRSLINAPYLDVDNGNLHSRPFIGDKLPQTKADSELLRTLALKHPEYKQTFLSSDGKYGALIIKTDFQVVAQNTDGFVVVAGQKPGQKALDILENIEEDETAPVIAGKKSKEITLTHHALSEYASFEKRIEDIISKEKYNQALKFSPTSWGTTWEKYIFQPELNITIACMNILIILLIFILFRSVSAIVWTLLIVSIPVGVMLGLAGWLQLDVKNSVYIAISLTMVSAIADVIHYLSGYNLFRKEGYTHIEALEKVFKESTTACLLTSLTTALGMLSLLLIPIIEIQNMGLLAAIGVLIGTTLTIIALPVMLDLWCPYSGKRIRGKQADSSLIQRMVRKIELIGVNHPLKVIVLSILPILFFAYQAKNINVDTLSINAWRKDEPARISQELINNKFGGISGINILLETGVKNGLKNPEVLVAMDNLAQTIKKQYPQWVTKSYSIVNETKYTYQNLNEGRSDMYKIPKDRSELEETLFLFNNANPEDRALLVTDDYSSASIYIRMKDPGSKLGEKIVNSARKDVHAILKDLKESYPDINITLTGNLVIKSAIKNYISWSQLKSFGLALLVISILLVVIFGSLKVGLLSLVPNIATIIITFGIMGWCRIALDETTLMVAPILIGIVVDDTIHFISHFRSNIYASTSFTGAIQSTFRVAGQAMVFTSIILFINFLLLNNVSHISVARFGWLSSVTIIVALLADLFLLPALLKIFNADYNVQKTKEQNRAKRLANKDGVVSDTFA